VEYGGHRFIAERVVGRRIAQVRVAVVPDWQRADGPNLAHP